MAFIDGKAKVNSDAKVYSTRKEYEQEKEIEKLKAENEKLRKCVEWYADEWNQINPKKARQTLEELK
ncbi:hypothetical protein [Kangiella sp.]|uniref:hypothetical protein n=1 Tax=Kangiella sp. TaxID=1920245 RepID=UPI003A94AB11